MYSITEANIRRHFYFNKRGLLYSVGLGGQAVVLNLSTSSKYFTDNTY